MDGGKKKKLNSVIKNVEQNRKFIKMQMLLRAFYQKNKLPAIQTIRCGPLIHQIF